MDNQGNLTSVSESFANGWSNPYRYDGRDGVRYDAADGLYWMRVRAYDPTVGRFLAHDSLGRAPLFFSGQPYAYAGNNPVSNVDPSGQYRASGTGAGARHESWKRTKRHFARIAKKRGCDKACQAQRQQEARIGRIRRAREIARKAEAYFLGQASTSFDVSDVYEGIASFLADFVLKSSLPTLLWASANVGIVAYDLISFVAAQFFSIQANESDAYWLDPGDLHGSWSRFGFTFALAGTLLLGLVLPLLMVTMPEMSVLWIGLEGGLGVAMFLVLRRVKQYIDQEEQALGYSES